MGSLKTFAVGSGILLSTALATMLGTSPVNAKPNFCAIDSINDISNGTTINFEEPGNTPNEILSPFNMQVQLNSNSDVVLTTETYVITGTSDAPVQNRGLFSTFGGSFRIVTTGTPWRAVGISAIPSAGTTNTTFKAYDINGNLLVSLTRNLVNSDGTIDGANKAATFLGLLSPKVPISSIELSGVNVVWDSLRFTPLDSKGKPDKCKMFDD